jgi:bifunctional non-homologous end joining protein LigD
MRELQGDGSVGNVPVHPFTDLPAAPPRRLPLAELEPLTRGLIGRQVAQLEHRARGVLRVGGQGLLGVTHLGRTVSTAPRYTKGTVLAYYAYVAPVLLPILRNRPLALVRHPTGVTGDVVHQHRPPSHVPAGVRVEDVARANGEEEPRVVGGDLLTLLYLAQLGAIEMHPWSSRTGSVAACDWAIVDLDPGPAVRFSTMLRVARRLKDEMDQLALHGALTTSGARGLHVYLPLPAETSYGTAAALVHRLARRVARALPTEVTLGHRVASRRPDQVYLDTGRNAWGQAVIAPFSLRAKDGLPVATPLEWDDLWGRVRPASLDLPHMIEDAAYRSGIWTAAMREPNRADAIAQALAPTS